MSLESIQKEILLSVELLKQEIREEFEEKRQRQKDLLDEQYMKAKEQALKLIEKEEKEKYVESILELKMDEKRKILSARQAIFTSILEQVKNSLETLLGEEAYYQFIVSKIEKFSEENDHIYVSNQDYPKFVEKLKKILPSNTVLKPTDRIKSGVIIEKKNFDYNFSTTSLLEEYFIDIENLLEQKLYV